MPVDAAGLERFFDGLRHRLGLLRGYSVVLVSDRRMRALNREFAGKDSATDVLSFPTGEEERIVDPYLGDIFISVETADQQKKGSLEDEIRVLGLHGLLHLLGYDHETDQGEMISLEKRLKNDLGLV